MGDTQLQTPDMLTAGGYVYNMNHETPGGRADRQVQGAQYLPPVCCD